MTLTKTRCKILIYITGVLALGYLVALLCFALNYITNTGNSRTFLEQVAYIPSNSHEIMLMIAIGVILLACMEICIELCFKHKRASLIFYACLIVEFLIGIWMNYYLLCGFSSVFFLVIGNIVLSSIKNWEKIVSIAFSSVFYIAIEVNQTTHFGLPCSISLLISYFGDGVASVQSIMVLLKTINTVAFIILCMASINTTRKEKQQIELLNAALKHTIDELNISNVQLRQQAKRDEEFAIYRERLRFSRDMHDIIGHVLTGVVVGLKACDALCEDEKSSLTQQIRRLSQLASNGLNELRQAIKDTRISAQESYSLLEEIKELVNSISKCVNADIHLEITGDLQMQLNSGQENVIYRIMQESITNAIRHANAQNLWISMNMGTNIDIHIENDGLVEEIIHEGFGLKNMRERVYGLGGRMEVRRDDRGLFTLDITIPANGTA